MSHLPQPSGIDDNSDDAAAAIWKSILAGTILPPRTTHTPSSLPPSPSHCQPDPNYIPRRITCHPPTHRTTLSLLSIYCKTTSSCSSTTASELTSCLDGYTQAASFISISPIESIIHLPMIRKPLSRVARGMNWERRRLGHVANLGVV